MNRIFQLLIILIGLSSFLIKSKPTEFNWQNIKEFKFYGFENPLKNENVEFIIADIEKVNHLFLKVNKTDPYFPKGANRFATVTFNDNTIINIQIIAGGEFIFRIIEKDLFNDRWYEDKNVDKIGQDYLSEITDKLKKF